jgi:hypothetical protein
VINFKLSDKAQWGDFREGFCGANKKEDFIYKTHTDSRHLREKPYGTRSFGTFSTISGGAVSLDWHSFASL